MKKPLLITIGTLLALLLAVRLCLIDIIDVPKGRCPRSGSWALVNRWAYGFRVPWDAGKRWSPVPVSLNDWVAYNHPTNSRYEKADTTKVCVSRCAAIPGDTIWYNNETGRISISEDVRNGFVHQLIVPGHSMRMSITPDNLRFYATTIMLHEPVKASIVSDSLCVSGKVVKEYTFQQDYYWMTNDDPKNLLDSSTFGFIPHASLIGKVL